jgi:lysophospholipase L1-like esterase
MMHRNRPTLRGAGAASALAAGVLVLGINPSPAASSADHAEASARSASSWKHDVTTWASSADRTTASLDTQTVRNVVHTSVAGSRLRIRLSNAFGVAPVTFDHAYVGIQDSGPAVLAGSNRELTFGNSTSITVPAGAQVLSDPLPGTFAAATNLAVSISVKGAAGTVTGHNVAHQHSYVSTGGDHAAEEDGAAFTNPVTSWYWLDAVVVTAAQSVDSVAVLGDSITDGTDSTTDANKRWSDVLARRLLQRPVPQQLGVLNEGIAGNMVTGDRKGVSAEARLDRDVLAQAGVTTVIVLEGINDINLGGPQGSGQTADGLIAGYRQLIARSHAAGVCVIGGTITPFSGYERFTPERERTRQTVNSFIRSSREFDAVVDFDRATRDPAHPERLLPAFDSGDHLHPSDAGHQAMGEAVQLRSLSCGHQ